MRWRAGILLREYRTFLVIMAAGLITGFLTWIAGHPAPACGRYCAAPVYYRELPGRQAGP